MMFKGKAVLSTQKEFGVDHMKVTVNYDVRYDIAKSIGDHVNRILNRLLVYRDENPRWWVV